MVLEEQAETDPEENSVRYFTSHKGEVDGTLKDGEFQYLHDDGQGNIALATTETATTSASTHVECAVRYDPWGNTDPVQRDTNNDGLADASGDLTDKVEGNPCEDNTQNTPTAVLYNETRRDRNNGNYQYGARTYQPDDATWLQPDTGAAVGGPSDLSIGVDPLTRNRYSYVNGDPINYVDPSGHLRDCECSHEDDPPPRPTAAGGLYDRRENAHHVHVSYGTRVRREIEAQAGESGFIQDVVAKVDECARHGLGSDDCSVHGSRPDSSYWAAVDSVAASLLNAAVGTGEVVQVEDAGLQDSSCAPVCSSQDATPVLAALGLTEPVGGPGVGVGSRADTIDASPAQIAGVAAVGGVYSLRDPVTGAVVRTGRSSNLESRRVQHRNDPRLRDFQFRIEYRANVYTEQRGLEHHLYERYPMAQATNGGFNMIRAISPRNGKITTYIRAAERYLARQARAGRR